MALQIDVVMDYQVGDPSDLLLCIEVAPYDGQRIISERLTGASGHQAKLPGVGAQRVLRVEGRLECRYSAKVEVTRGVPDFSRLPATPIAHLPDEVRPYLWPSRYCQSDQLGVLAGNKFGGFEGGERVAAIRDWISENIAYVSGASTATTTALDSYISRQGVCRDYAHLMVALARAGDVPARMASVYAPDVDPPDFHAVAEVFLDGAWHFVDPTGMANASEIALIASGRDAADIAFMTSFAPAELETQTVSVARC